MKLKMIKALWGMTGSLEEQFHLIAKAGYEGIEAPLPAAEEESRFKELLDKHRFDYIAMVFTQDDHIGSFESQVERALSFSPILINAHSAKDSMPYDKQLAFYERAVAVEKEAGVPIAHETHRGRAMFTPWTTARLLQDVDGLNITADFSHWCCVCESLLEDQAENLRLAVQRTVHVHARVGYAEGPQVPDPRAPEYARELEAHEKWWDEIVAARASQGAGYLTVTPEFGPPGYMHTLPFTNQPVADLWDVCLWMAQRLKAKYSS